MRKGSHNFARRVEIEPELNLATDLLKREYYDAAYYVLRDSSRQEVYYTFMTAKQHMTSRRRYDSARECVRQAAKILKYVNKNDGDEEI